MSSQLNRLARRVAQWRRGVMAFLPGDDSVARWRSIVKAGAADVPASWVRLPVDTQVRRLIEAERDRVSGAVWAFDESATAAVLEVARSSVDLPMTSDMLPSDSGMIAFAASLIDDADVVAVTWGPADPEQGSGVNLTVWCTDHGSAAVDPVHTLMAAGTSIQHFDPLWTVDQTAAADTSNPTVVVNRAIIAALAAAHTALSVEDFTVDGAVVQVATTRDVSQAAAAIVDALPNDVEPPDGGAEEVPVLSRQLHVRHDPLFDTARDTEVPSTIRWVPQRHREVTDRLASLAASIESRYPYVFDVVERIRLACRDEPDRNLAQEIARALYHHYGVDTRGAAAHAVVIAGLDIWDQEGRHVVYAHALEYLTAASIDPAATDCPRGPSRNQPAGLVLTTPARAADLLVYFHQFSNGLHLMHVDIPHDPAPSLETSASLTQQLLLTDGTIAQAATSALAGRGQFSHEAITDTASYNAHTTNLLAMVTAPDSRVSEAGHLLGRRPETPWPTTPIDQPDSTSTLWIMEDTATNGSPKTIVD